MLCVCPLQEIVAGYAAGSHGIRKIATNGMRSHGIDAIAQQQD